ncbi:MAG: glycosyltransferase [Anaerolineae bacterium]
MMKQGGIAAIVWAPDSPHAEHDAQRLNASLHKIHYLRYKRPLLAPIKYVPQCLKTWAVLRRQRPSVVYVIISPVVAALSVYIYCRLSGTPYIMDVHGHSLTSWKWAWTAPLQRALAKRALVNIVNHPGHKRLFESWGAKSLVLERSPMSIPGDRLKQVANPNQYSVTVVSTFTGDEPLELVLGAAEQLPEVRFFILGDTALAKRTLLRAAPDNVVFPGYLLGDEYWNRLYSSQAVMVLTTHPYSLLSGAVEGMALGKPLILSRQPVLTDYFTKGTIFVDNSVESIVDGVRELRGQEHRLTQEIVELAAEKRERWETVFQELLALIGGDPCKASRPGG